MKNCIAFLKDLHELMKAFSIKEQSRNYWKKFSKAYWVLYEEGKTFLPEILDAA